MGIRRSGGAVPSRSEPPRCKVSLSAGNHTITSREIARRCCKLEVGLALTGNAIHADGSGMAPLTALTKRSSLINKTSNT